MIGLTHYLGVAAALFVIGIFGEYLARMHFRIMDKPPYAVTETINLTEGEK